MIKIGDYTIEFQQTSGAYNLFENYITEKFNNRVRYICFDMPIPYCLRKIAEYETAQGGKDVDTLESYIKRYEDVSEKILNEFKGK